MKKLKPDRETNAYANSEMCFDSAEDRNANSGSCANQSDGIIRS